MKKNRNNYSNFKGKREKRGRERKRGAKKVQDRDLASKRNGKDSHPNFIESNCLCGIFIGCRRWCKDPQRGVHPFLTLIDRGETTDASQTRLPPPSAVSPLSIP